MSSEERKQILKMVEGGKISAEQAARLMQALKDAAGEETEPPGAEPWTSPEPDMPEFEAVKARARRFAALPLWSGVLLTILSSYWLFILVQKSSYGFGFALAWLLLVLGALLTALSAGGLNARWLYVNIDQQPGEWPQHITLGFPMPLGVLRWALRNFGHYARDMDQARAQEFLSLLGSTNFHEPLVVNVDEGGNGERVQVYIG